MSPQSDHPLTLIPSADLARFHRETAACRREVLHWLAHLASLPDAKNRQRGFSAVAAATATSPSTVRRKYYAWRKQGWLGLVNRSRYPLPGKNTLPAPFLTHWKTLLEQHQRDDVGRQAHRVLLTQLDRWARTADPAAAVPGYTAPPAADSWCGTARRHVPAGWSYRNLIRHQPRTINLVLRRRGPKAAAMHLPSNYTTRAGLKVLERVFFDDQEYDTKVVLPGKHGNSKPMRPMGFNALDHLTAKFVNHVIKLTRHDLDDGSKKQLNQRDFVWMVIATLQRAGYRDDSTGTAYIFEHGTATGYAGFDTLLNSVTGGRVTVHRSGRFGDPAFADMHFRGQSSGNFKFKAPLESIFHLVRTHMAALPGPTGRHFGAKPEESHGLDSYGKKMLALYNSLDHHLAELVRFPFLTFPQFLALAHAIYTAIDTRTDHHLEGWQSAGFSAPEWRLGDDTPWLPQSKFLDLPPDKQQLAADLIERRVRHMSPAEAYAQARQADRHKITHLDDSFIPALVPHDWAYPVKVTKQHEIVIHDQLQDPEPMHYMARVQTPTGHSDNLQPGAQFRALLNPYHPDRLHLLDTAGRYIGVASRWVKPVASDTEAILRNQGAINQFRSEVTAPAKARAQGQAAGRQEMLTHNDRLTNSEPTDPADIAAARQQKRASSKAADQFDAMVGEASVQPPQPTPPIDDTPGDDIFSY